MGKSMPGRGNSLCKGPGAGKLWHVEELKLLESRTGRWGLKRQPEGLGLCPGGAGSCGRARSRKTLGGRGRDILEWERLRV